MILELGHQFVPDESVLDPIYVTQEPISLKCFRTEHGVQLAVLTVPGSL